MLQIVAPPPPEPWHREPDEDEAEYLLFLAWLHTPTPRAQPDYAQIALTRDWASRANAYDTQSALPTKPKDLLQQALTDALTFSAVEIRKWARKTLTAGADVNVAQIREIVTVLNMLTENKDQLKQVLESTDDDLASLTDDQLRAVVEAKKALATLGKGKR